MLGGGPAGIYCLRQQLKPSDSHVAEISAGGTVLHRIIPIQGLLQEVLIPQVRPTPVYTDSQSTIFCANAAASSRLSVWVNRRSGVLREAVDTRIVSMEKIGDPDNVANYFTKPVTTTVMNHYFDYMLPTGRHDSFANWSAGYNSDNATAGFVELAPDIGTTKDFTERHPEFSWNANVHTWNDHHVGARTGCGTRLC